MKKSEDFHFGRIEGLAEAFGAAQKALEAAVKGGASKASIELLDDLVLDLDVLSGEAIDEATKNGFDF